MANLLLVDNDARITDLTSWFLKRSGHEVRCVESYAAARDVLREAPPDLLLADLELGVESGLEELPRLASEGLLPKTLVVSGFLDARIAEELKRIPGVLGTVSKPFEIADLEGEIRRHLESPGSVTSDQENGLVHEQASGSNALESPAQEVFRETALEEPDEDGWVEIVPIEGPTNPESRWDRGEGPA